MSLKIKFCCRRRQKPFYTAPQKIISQGDDLLYSYDKSVISLQKNIHVLTNTIRIGILDNTVAQQNARILEAAFSALEIPSELVLIADQTALLLGDVDVLAIPMAQLPPFLPEGWKIGAVSERLDPAEVLLLKTGTPGSDHLFGLPTGAVVGCSSPLQLVQFHEFRPDLELILTAPGLQDPLELFSEGISGLIFPAHSLVSFSPDPAQFKVIRLHPSEMVPYPAQGVMAWIVNVWDLPVRRLLRRIHHPEVSAVTNIERMALRLLPPETYAAFGACCYRDNHGNFHVHGVLVPPDRGALKRASLSSSTSFRLAERLVNALTTG